MKILSIIPARSGSKRIIHKNIKLIAGKPLLYYQIKCAKMVKEIDKIIVATDDLNYKKFALEYGADVIMRPAIISGPKSKSEETLLYVIDQLEQQDEYYDYVVFLQATSPLNKPEYVTEGIKLITNGDYNSVLTYSEFVGYFLDDPDIIDRPMTQDKAPRQLETGCFWITKVSALKKNKNRICEPVGKVKVPRYASYEIDTEEDLLVIESLLNSDKEWNENCYYTIRERKSPEEGDFYDEKLDPDGNKRNLTTEKEQRIEFAKDEIAFINSIVDLNKNQRFLDIGCGLGFISSAINDHYKKYGLEVSEKSIEYAKQYITHVHKGILLDDTYEEEFFDVILCFHVIEHVPDPIEFLKIIHRILKTHGYLVLTTPNFGCGLAKLFKDKFRLLHDASHISLFTDYTLIKLLEHTGFHVEKTEYPFFDTKYFTEENLLRLFDTDKMSPPFYGNIVALYVQKK